MTFGATSSAELSGQKESGPVVAGAKWSSTDVISPVQGPSRHNPGVYADLPVAHVPELMPAFVSQAIRHESLHNPPHAELCRCHAKNGTMNYTHEFVVNAPVDAVREFHSRSASMGAITPPPVIVRVHQAPDILEEGDEMEFTMWLGPMPIGWHARIEDVTPTSFVDRQLRGPFTQWVHTHTFTALDEQRTVVHDQIVATYRNHWWWRLVGMGMWLNMPILFAYRQWKTRRILEHAVSESVTAHQ